MQNDLISRKLLIERLAYYHAHSYGKAEYAYGVATEEVVKAPTIDAVPVVRCRECIHHTRTKSRLGFSWCARFGNIMRDDDFCSIGERRKDGGASDV